MAVIPKLALCELLVKDFHNPKLGSKAFLYKEQRNIFSPDMEPFIFILEPRISSVLFTILWQGSIFLES